MMFLAGSTIQQCGLMFRIRTVSLALLVKRHQMGELVVGQTAVSKLLHYTLLKTQEAVGYNPPLFCERIAQISHSRWAVFIVMLAKAKHL